LFKQLYEQLAAKGLMEGMDEKQLKSKIKTIRDVYRHEIAKIERNQKSGAGIEELYSPKLLWFNSAHFCHSHFGVLFLDHSINHLQ
jgi:hypothetical protein